MGHDERVLKPRTSEFVLQSFSAAEARTLLTRGLTAADLLAHYSTDLSHWRQRRRGCRGHIPPIFWLGDVNGNIPPNIITYFRI